MDTSNNWATSGKGSQSPTRVSTVLTGQGCHGGRPQA